MPRAEAPLLSCSQNIKDIYSSRLFNIGYVFFILWFIKNINSIQLNPQNETKRNDINKSPRENIHATFVVAL